MIVQALQGLVYVKLDFEKCSDLVHKIEDKLNRRKDVDPLVYSVFYDFCIAYYRNKNKFKLLYSSALQYLAYTPLSEMQETKKISIMVEMGVAALISQ